MDDITTRQPTQQLCVVENIQPIQHLGGVETQPPGTDELDMSGLHRQDTHTPPHNGLKSMELEPAGSQEEKCFFCGEGDRGCKHIRICQTRHMSASVEVILRAFAMTCPPELYQKSMSVIHKELLARRNSKQRAARKTKTQKARELLVQTFHRRKNPKKSKAHSKKSVK